MAVLDINSQIDRELATAKKTLGRDVRIECLEGSRGDTLDDEDLLRMLRYFRDHGTVYSSVIASREVEF